MISSLGVRSRIGQLLTAISVILIALILLLPTAPARQIPAFLLLWVVPGLAWSLALPGTLSERFVIGAGVAFSAIITSAIVVSYLPGPVNSTFLLLATFIISVAPLLFSMRLQKHRRESSLSVKRSKLNGLLFVSFLAALFFRTVNMGYKEIQGDEGIILTRAAAVITGDESSLFLHQKGPAEILLPLVTWSVTGEINEIWARLPFTWMSVISVVAIFALGRTWAGNSAGLLAGSLMALNGLSIAFGRIVQYQSLVTAWGVLAILSAVGYKRKGGRGQILLSSFFCSSAILAHYDGVLFAIVAAWIILSGQEWRSSRHYRLLVAGLALGFAHLALFYLPYFFSPNFVSTFEYLVGDRIGANSGNSLLGWSGSEVWRMLTFYNSSWYVVLILGFMLLGVFVIIREKNIYDTEIVLAAIVPGFFYLFVVTDPRTHIYTFLPGVLILAGIGLVQLGNVLYAQGRLATILAIIGGLMVLVVFALYPFWLFVDVTPERQRTWPENRPLPLLYWTTWDEPPEYGLFGFPHQAGWRAVSQYLSPDDLPYASNEEREITSWYTGQARRTHCRDFKTLIIAVNAQDELSIEPSWFEDLHLNTQLMVLGKDSLRIYGREKIEEPREVDATRVMNWYSPEEIAPPKRSGAHPVHVTLGSKVVLLGYDVDESKATADGQVVVTLYWQALETFKRNYQVFVHLAGKTQLAQHDGAPECAVNPTTRWEPGEIIVDPHIVEIPADFQPQTVQLVVGMYDLLTGERLLIANTEDNALFLSELRIAGIE